MRVLRTFPLLLPLLLLAPATARADREAWTRAEVAARFGPDARVSWDGLGGAARALRRLDAPAPGSEPTAAARAFLSQHGDLLGGLRGEDLGAPAVRRQRDRTVVHFQQMAAGLPVDGRFVAVTLTTSGRIRAVHSDFVPVRLTPLAADVGAEGARAAVAAAFPGRRAGRATRVVAATAPGVAAIAYRVTTLELPAWRVRTVMVDAATGRIVGDRAAGLDQGGPR